MENKIPNIIEFVKHMNKWCDYKVDSDNCEGCPYNYKAGYRQICAIGDLLDQPEEELTDLVREVERWWRENDQKKND